MNRILLFFVALASPLHAQDLAKVVAIQKAKIDQLQRSIPVTLHERQKDSPTYAATTDWTTMPGLQLEYELKEPADVKLEMDGGISAKIKGVHCSASFQLNGVILGNPVYGEGIVMGEDGNHWSTISRSRMILNQQPGKYVITLAVRAIASAGLPANSACYYDPSQDYSRFNLHATIVKK